LKEEIMKVFKAAYSKVVSLINFEQIKQTVGKLKQSAGFQTAQNTLLSLGVVDQSTIDSTFEAVTDANLITSVVMDFKEKGIEEVKKKFENFNVPTDSIEIFLMFCKNNRKKMKQMTEKIISKRLDIDKNLVPILMDVLFPN